MPTLDSRSRAHLPDSAFAYVDSAGRRRLPINDESHVRNALARFEQTAFEDDAARERARGRLLRAAKKYGIVPLGFFDHQLRKERVEGEIRARAGAVATLPRGVVTFLLTDIEDSTALVRALADGYARVLRDVRTAIRTRVREAGGLEVDSRADEFFAVFKRPPDALDAAVAIQRALGGRAWPGQRAVRVRIGLHTGRPSLTETGYVGIAVHTAARVCNAGHGGQILVSAASRDALVRGLRDGITFRALGAYRLAGLPDPEPLAQVVAAELSAKFPRLRVPAVRRG
jgi:class 3 adenylate cyclase